MKKVLVGLAIDVSASMQESINNSSAGKTRFDTILDALNAHIQRINERIRKKNKSIDDVRLFAYIFGLNDEKRGAVCDFFGLINEFNNPERREDELKARLTVFDDIRTFAEDNGKWVGDPGFLEKEIPELTRDSAVLLLRLCKEDEEFRQYILNILPSGSVGKDIGDFGKKASEKLGEHGLGGKIAGGIFEWITTNVGKRASKVQGTADAAIIRRGKLNRLEKELREKLAYGEIQRKAMLTLIKKIKVVTFTLPELATFWQKSFERSRGDIEKVIFGCTPMCAVLKAVEERFAAEEHFAEPEYTGDSLTKILCLVSDGLPNDGKPLPIAMQLQSQYQLQIVACYITNRDVATSKTIFEKADENWDDGAKLMFKMASSVNIDPIYPQKLRDSGWSIPPRGKLFFQLNHSDILESILNIVTTSREYDDED